MIRLQRTLAVAILLGSLVTPARAASDECGSDAWRVTDGQSSSRRPVVLVHGWRGDPMTSTASALSRRLVDRIATFTFDYQARSLYWASDTRIAGCLSSFLDAVSQAHRTTGGDGRIVVIAHSMGGLALRYALQGKGNTVPNVITMGTPNLGSPWGATWVADTIHNGEALLGKEKPSRAQTAALCLGVHDKGKALPEGCGADLPPWLPARTKLTQVAGDVTVDRTLFGIHLYSLPLFGDGVVSVPSAHGYWSSGPGGESPPDGARLTNLTEACRIDHGLMSRLRKEQALAVPLWMLLDYVTLQDLQSNTLSPATGWYSILAAFSAGCSHIGQPNDDHTLVQVANALSEAVDELAPPVPVNPADYRLPEHPNELYYFRSPSTNFSCGIITLPPSAGCHGTTAPVPPRPEDCNARISWGRGLFVHATGKTGFICTGGAIYSNGFGRDDPVLPYGRSLTAHGFTCVSRQSGVTCTHHPTDHGFRIAAESNEQF